MYALVNSILRQNNNIRYNTTNLIKICKNWKALPKNFPYDFSIYLLLNLTLIPFLSVSQVKSLIYPIKLILAIFISFFRISSKDGLNYMSDLHTNNSVSLLPYWNIRIGYTHVLHEIKKASIGMRTLIIKLVSNVLDQTSQ